MCKEVKECSGQCCEFFVLPCSPEQLWTAYYKWLSEDRQHRGATLISREHGADRVYNDVGQYLDVHLIAPMAVYLGEYTEPPYEEAVPEWPEGAKRHVYTCKHHDKETRRCTIYDFRPSMCREYPYQAGCNYKGCTHARTREVVLAETACEKAKNVDVKKQLSDMVKLSKKE